MAETENRLATLLQDYMWSQRPPLTPSKLARKIGVSHQSVYNWMSGVTRPEIATLTVVAEKTGIPLKALLDAVGYPTPPDPDDVFDYIIRQIGAAADIEQEEKERVIKHLEALRKHYQGAQDLQQALREVCLA